MNSATVVLLLPLCLPACIKVRCLVTAASIGWPYSANQEGWGEKANTEICSGAETRQTGTGALVTETSNTTARSLGGLDP